MVILYITFKILLYFVMIILKNLSILNNVNCDEKDEARLFLCCNCKDDMYGFHFSTQMIDGVSTIATELIQ